MKKGLLITVILLLCTVTMLPAQRGNGYTDIRTEISGKDTITVVDIVSIPVFRRKIDTRRYAKLIANIKAVYPIAKEAKTTLMDMETYMLNLKTEREQKEYVKLIEQMLKRKYTPILKKMTYSQGKILIKLIDRETSHSSYELVKELRGGFSAFFYQGIARMFGANLKEKYDRYGEDLVLEHLIMLYEAGML